MLNQPVRSVAPALGPQVAKRLASSVAGDKHSLRQGRKGHPYGPKPDAPAVTPEEAVHITKRRIAKAERDERMDTTSAFTPVKKHLGGLTSSRDLRSSNWFPGGRYADSGKVYKASPGAAYESHTVSLLESRPMSQKQNAAMLEQVQAVAAMYSTPSTLGGARAFHTSAVGRGAHSYNEDHVVPDFYLQHKRRKNPEASDDTAPSNPPSSPTSKGPQTEVIVETHGSLMEQLSDSILSDDLAASTMRRLKSKTPHEHFNEDGILVHPSGFVIPTPGEAEVPMSEKRVRDIKLQTAAVAERVQEEGSYTDINAHTRLQENKIPYEVIEEDGSVSHPSGFVPPTAAHEFKYSDSSSVDNHVQDAVQRQRRRATTIHLSNTEAEKRQKKSEAMFAMDEDDADLIAELKAGLKDVASKAKGGN